MTGEKIADINAERLDSWEERLTKAHATALVLVGVGHDHNSGEIVLCTIKEKGEREGLTHEQLAGFLRWAANQLERRK